jgi:uncharacterized membrane protein YhfC
MNSILYFTYPFGIILVLVLVIGLSVYLTRKYNLGWRLFWIGAVLFILAQVLHIPFNILLDRLFRDGVLPTPPEEWQLLFSALLVGLSAGLFEELIRYAGIRWWAKDARSWSRGLLFGTGWGGMEAIIFFIVPLSLNFVLFSAIRNMDLSTLVSPEQISPLQEGLNFFWSVAWYDSLLGAVERILILPIQISLTILVIQVFIRGQSGWLWIAIGWHALLDGVLVISVSLWGAYATEGIIGIFALTSIGIIYALRKEEPVEAPQEEDLDEQPFLPPIDLPPIEGNPENIERTRYTD